MSQTEARLPVVVSVVVNGMVRERRWDDVCRERAARNAGCSLRRRAGGGHACQNVGAGMEIKGSHKLVVVCRAAINREQRDVVSEPKVHRELIRRLPLVLNIESINPTSV